MFATLWVMVKRGCLFIAKHPMWSTIGALCVTILGFLFALRWQKSKRHQAEQETAAAKVDGVLAVGDAKEAVLKEKRQEAQHTEAAAVKKAEQHQATQRKVEEDLDWIERQYPPKKKGG